MSNRRETPEDARAASQEHKKNTSIDRDSLFENFARIAQGKPAVYKTGEPSGLTDTTIDDPDSGYAGDHIDFSGVVGEENTPVVKTSEKTADFGDITPIISDIANFKFSSNRQSEINELRKAIKSQMIKIVHDRVVANTRDVSEGAERFYRQSDGSLRVEFNVLNQKYSMKVSGNMTGDECLCWNVSGNSVVGHVMRKNAGKYDHVSNEYSIEVASGWKK